MTVRKLKELIAGLADDTKVLVVIYDSDIVTASVEITGVATSGCGTKLFAYPRKKCDLSAIDMTESRWIERKDVG